jgi:diaminopimelate decarboxylase
MNWWETDFVAVSGNKLLVAGRDTAALAERYGTPLYIYGKDRILERYARLEDAWARHSSLPARICYAMKANPHRGILRLLQRRGAWIDAVSPCEVETALKAGFPPERVIFTGTSVSRADLRSVFAVKGLTVNIDAAEQIDLMSEVKREFPSREIRVSVRWNPGIGRGFNARVITAGKRSSDGTPIKFGVEAKKVLGVFTRAS